MLDAAGYRSIMVALLADRYYQNTTLFPVLIGSHFTPPLVVQEMSGIATIRLPEVLRPSDEKLVIRDGSIFVLSHLEAGGIDYAFEYRSVAEGHDLRWINLPPEIDLSSPDFADEYGKVQGNPGISAVQCHWSGEDRAANCLCSYHTEQCTKPGTCRRVCRSCDPDGEDRGERLAGATELICDHLTFR